MPHVPTYRELESIVLRLYDANKDITEAYGALCKQNLANTGDSFAYVTPMNRAQDRIAAAMKAVKDLGEN